MAVASPFREAVKPPLFVPVLRDRLLGEFGDGKPVRFGSGKNRLDDVRGKAVQGKNAADVAGFQASRDVGNLVAFDDILENNKVAVFLKNLDSGGKIGIFIYFRESADVKIPVHFVSQMGNVIIGKMLRNGFEHMMILQKFDKRKRQNFLADGAAAHGGFHFGRQHLGGRPGQDDMDVRGVDKTADKMLPALHILDFVEEEIAFFLPVVVNCKGKSTFGKNEER